MSSSEEKRYVSVLNLWNFLAYFLIPDLKFPKILSYINENLTILDIVRFPDQLLTLDHQKVAGVTRIMDYTGRVGLDVCNFKIRIGGFTLHGIFFASLDCTLSTSKATHD